MPRSSAGHDEIPDIRPGHWAEAGRGLVENVFTRREAVSVGRCRGSSCGTHPISRRRTRWLAAPAPSTVPAPSIVTVPLTRLSNGVSMRIVIADPLRFGYDFG